MWVMIFNTKQKQQRKICGEYCFVLHEEVIYVIYNIFYISKVKKNKNHISYVRVIWINETCQD